MAPNERKKILDWISENTRTFRGVNSGDYIDKDDLTTFIESLSTETKGIKSAIKEAVQSTGKYKVKKVWSITKEEPQTLDSGETLTIEIELNPKP